MMISIDGKQYTKSSLLQRCSEILKATPVGGSVGGDDKQFLLSVFELHPEWEQKQSGKKIVEIQKRLSGRFGSACFWIFREDGTSTDISFRRILEKNRAKKDVLQALRNAIRPDIEAFRSAFHPMWISGIYYETLDGLEVDHYDLPFKEVASLWIEANGGVDNISKFVNETEDGDTTTFLTDKTLVESFRQFHNEHTHLQFLPKEENRHKEK